MLALGRPCPAVLVIVGTFVAMHSSDPRLQLHCEQQLEKLLCTPCCQIADGQAHVCMDETKSVERLQLLQLASTLYQPRENSSQSCRYRLRPNTLTKLPMRKSSGP